MTGFEKRICERAVEQQTSLVFWTMFETKGIFHCDLQGINGASWIPEHDESNSRGT